MLTVLYWLLLIINVIFLVLRKKSKVLLVIDFVFAFILFYGNMDNPDYSYYKSVYNASDSFDWIWNRKQYEIGYSILNLIFNNLGFSYNLFVGVLWIIGGLIYVTIFSKFSDKFELLFITYFSYFIFIDIIQIRAFFASSILCISLYYYIKNKKINSIIWMIITITIHVEMIFFLPLILFIDPTKKMSKKAIKKTSIIVILFCVFSVLLGITNNSIVRQIGGVVLNFAGADGKSVYLESSTKYGSLLYFFPHLFTIFTCKVINNLIKRNSESSEGIVAETDNNTEKKELLERIFNIQYYCIFSFIFIMMNMNFYRLYKSIYLFNIIFFALGLDLLKNNENRYYKCLIISVFSMFLYRLLPIVGNDLINDILENNFLLKGE